MIPVIDLFAGPGGLGEGFSSLVDENGNPVFQTIMSIEKDPQAHRTLRLRSFFRKIYQSNGRSIPRAYIQYLETHDSKYLEALKEKYSSEWTAAEEEALCAELVDGDYSRVREGEKRLRDNGVEAGGQWVLIGGPPCQAYSLVGRSRRTHDKESLENDVKQTLYKCYLAFIRELQPTVFVMENVKGLLSARHSGEGVFGRICADMDEAGYEVRSLVKQDPCDPRDYVVRAERYGIPQTRHRVILLGVKKGCERPSKILSTIEGMTVRKAFVGIPAVRSGFSKRSDGSQSMSWSCYVDEAARKIIESPEGKELEEILTRVCSQHPPKLMVKSLVTGETGRYEQWYRGRLGRYRVLANHQSRTHMAADLDRYLFCSAYAELHGIPAKIEVFPHYLYPNHKNVQQVESGEGIEFSDRFRVQVWDKPSTTVTSHIAKDGNYYIHPDPAQCRSLTVREAARLQTFPDDYLFEGNRTSQYTQVGNAVPPLLAQQIGKVVAEFLDVSAYGFCDSLRLVSGDCVISGDTGNHTS